MNQNTTWCTSEAGTADPSVAPEFTPCFQWGSCYSIFSFICMFCRSLFVLLYFFFGHGVVCSSSIYEFWLPLWYLLALSVLPLPYPFGILLYYLSFLCLTLLVSYCIICPSSALPLWYLIVFSVLLLPYPFGILLYYLSFFCLTLFQRGKAEEEHTIQ
jgi:hypothetical protein